MGQMAQKISKVDHDELLKALNEALSEEWLAYYQYWVGALVAKGPMRTSIVAEFMEHANEEYDHANKLGKRIIELGGTPVLDPKQWENLARCNMTRRATTGLWSWLSRIWLQSGAPSPAISRFAK